MNFDTDGLNDRRRSPGYGESLEAQAPIQATSQTARMTPSDEIVTPTHRPSYRVNGTAIVVTGVALLLIVAALLGGLFLSGRQASDPQKAAIEKVNNYKVTEVSVKEVRSNPSIGLGRVDKLSVNGQLKVSDTLVLTPTSVPQSPTTGQIYFDKTTNTPFYFNGSQFVSLAPTAIPQAVTSLGGSAGVIGLGNGLSVANGQLTIAANLLQTPSGSLNTPRVSSLQGLTGDVTLVAGPGIGISGTIIRNNGVIELEAGSGGVTVSNNGSGKYAVSVSGAGAGTFTLNGILFGNGSGTLQATAAGTTGQCLLATTGSAPTWGACTGAGSVNSLTGSTGSILTGAITINNSNSSGSAITIDDASTSAKGIAQFDSSDFDVASGVVTLDSTVTQQGNTFNGISQLVQLNGSGYLPALNGSALTDLDAGSIATGTLGVARLSGSYTGITGTGTLTVGSIASGFGAIATANTIQGTTLNGTTGINTGASGGTQRIDASGNLVNINNITAAGLINGSTLTSSALTFGAASAASIQSASGQDLTIDSGTTGAINIGTSANAKVITIGNNTGASAVNISSGSGGVNIGNGGVANTIQIGNTTGAVAQTINLGTNATASSSSTVTIGSSIGSSSTTIQAGSSGVVVKPANSITAFQIQNASSTTLFNTDTNNNKINITNSIATVGSLTAGSAPTPSADANTGGTLSGNQFTTYYYKVTAITSGGETAPTAEGSINGASFTALSAPGSALTATANAAAGNPNGTYTYKVTFLTTNGETTGSSASSSVTVASKKIDLSSIPTGGTGTTKRQIYRTGGADATYKLLATLFDNTTTTYQDNTADTARQEKSVPSSNTARTDLNQVSLSFGSVAGASGYRVYRSTTSGSFTSYQSVASSPFTDLGSSGTPGVAPLAFQVQNASGTNIIGVDTEGTRVTFAGLSNCDRIYTTSSNALACGSGLERNISRIEVSGHSWTAGTGASSTGNRFTTRLASALHAQEYNFGVSGAGTFGYSSSTPGLAAGGVGHALQKLTRDRTAAPYLPAAGIGVISNGANDLELYQDNTTMATEALRTTISRFRASAVFEESDASVNYGGLTTATVNGGGWQSGVGSKDITSTGTYTITVPSDFPGGTIDLGYIVSIDGSGAVHSFTVDGNAAGSIDNRCSALGNCGRTIFENNSIVKRLTNLAPGSHTIVGTVSSLSTKTNFDYWQIEANPPQVVAIANIARMPDSSIIGGNKSDPTIMKFNAAIQGLVGEFDSSVILVDIDSALNKDPTSFLAGDPLHPNDKGYATIADAFYKAIQNASVSADQVRYAAAGVNNTSNNVVFQNSLNSTSAFQIQNSDGASLLNVDTSSVGSNLLGNGSFEKAISASAPNWLPTGGASVSQNSTEKYIGDKSATVTTGATAKDGLKQALFLAPSTQYSLSFMAKITSGTFTTLSAGYSYDGTAANESNCTLSSTTLSTSGWNRYTCTITTSASFGFNPYPYVYINQTDAAARTFYVDGVTLNAGSSARLYQQGTLALNGVVSSPTTFTNQSDSTNALQITQSNGNSVMTVDTLNRKVSIGGTTAGNTVLDLQGTSGTTLLTLSPATGASTDSAYIGINANRAVFGYDGAGGNAIVQGGTGRGVVIQTNGSTNALTLTSTGAATFTNSTNSTAAFQVRNASNVALFTADTSSSKLIANSDLVANRGTAGVSATTSGTGTDVTTVTFSGTTSFANGDVIFIDNAGQDYYTRITAGANAASVTVSPAVTFENGRTATKYVTQNIGAVTSTNDYSTQSDRFFQGYFLGGVVVGAGSTTLSDGNLQSTTSLSLQVGASGTLNVGTTSQTSALNLGNTSASSTTLIRGGTGSSALSLITGSGGTLSLGNGGVAGTIQIGNTTGGVAQTINIGTNATASSSTTLTLGSTIDASSTTIRSGSGGIALTGAVTGSNTIQGTTLNGTIGINTGASGGTQRIDASGNLVNINNITAAGLINGNTLTSSALTFGAASAASIQSASGQDLTIDSGATGAINIGTSANAKVITIGNNTGATEVNLSVGSGGLKINGSAGVDLACGANIGIKTVTVTKGIITGGVCTTNNLTDLAEQFNSTDSLVAAEVVTIDPSNNEYVKRTNGTYQTGLVGVVSTAPNMVLGEDNPGYPIALAGRVPVKVSNENGTIQPGDYLTSSSIPGVAMKATAAGPTIGKAMTTDDGSGKVIIFVNPSYYAGESVASYIQNGGDATLSALTVTGSADFGSLNVSGAATIGELTVTGNVTIGGTLTVVTIKTGNIEIDGHIITRGAVPTSQVLAAAGTSALVDVDGNDTAGTISITTGSAGVAAGDLSKINFSKIFTKTPKVLLTGQDDNSINARIYPKAKSVNDFMMSTSQSLAPNTTYTFDYFIVE